MAFWDRFRKSKEADGHMQEPSMEDIVVAEGKVSFYQKDAGKCPDILILLPPKEDFNEEQLIFLSHSLSNVIRQKHSNAKIKLNTSEVRRGKIIIDNSPVVEPRDYLTLQDVRMAIQSLAQAYPTKDILDESIRQQAGEVTLTNEERIMDSFKQQAQGIVRSIMPTIDEYIKGFDLEEFEAIKGETQASPKLLLKQVEFNQALETEIIDHFSEHKKNSMGK